ncbi:thiamine-phosphate pyrophosphorylase [Streptococcus pneumoniae]|nr:thiamine-phosphate pyrophosphorylase [Streptococcus pneumoniae]
MNREALRLYLVTNRYQDSVESFLAKVEYVDYVGVGPVFDTQSKDDAGGAIGYEGLELMRKLLPQMPLVAIGGIQTKHIKDIIKTNVDGVSIISAISYAKNIEKTVREMSEQ